MNDYISRHEAIATAFAASGLGNSKYRDVCDIAERLRKIPAADVIEIKSLSADDCCDRSHVKDFALDSNGLPFLSNHAERLIKQKHGEWKEVHVECFGGGTITNYECQVCGEKQIVMSNFCPNCGARMVNDDV